MSLRARNADPFDPFAPPMDPFDPRNPDANFNMATQRPDFNRHAGRYAVPNGPDNGHQTHPMLPFDPTTGIGLNRGGDPLMLDPNSIEGWTMGMGQPGEDPGTGMGQLGALSGFRRARGLGGYGVANSTGVTNG